MANPFVQSFGPLKGWQWVAAGGAGLGIVLFLRQRAAAKAAASSSTDATGGAFAGTGPYPGYGQILPVVIQQGPASQPLPPNPTPSPTKPQSKLAPPPNVKMNPGERIISQIADTVFGPSAGYYLTNQGGVYAVGGAPFAGSGFSLKGFNPKNWSKITLLPGGRGYELTGSNKGKPVVVDFRPGQPLKVVRS